MANAMQSFHQNPLTAQSSLNPLTNSTLLATLLVPQLEAYLASNTSTRLLILQYTSTDLPTILALRDLLGLDLFKVAGILDSTASDPSPAPASARLLVPSPTPTPLPPPIPANPLSNAAVNSRLSRRDAASLQVLDQALRPRPTTIASIRALPKLNTTRTKPISAGASFSKCNYLLPWAATDSEISTFLTTITEPLVEKSPFYTPEPAPEPLVIEKFIPAPPPIPISLPTPTTPSPTTTYPPFRPSGHASKISRLTGAKHSYTPSISSTKKGYSPSIASTKTTATEKGRRVEREWENFYIAEEDSDDDAYDKMILGRDYAKIVPEVRKPAGQQMKRPTKKALKWLGLA